MTGKEFAQLHAGKRFVNSVGRTGVVVGHHAHSDRSDVLVVYDDTYERARPYDVYDNLLWLVPQPTPPKYAHFALQEHITLMGNTPNRNMRIREGLDALERAEQKIKGVQL